MQVSVHGSGEEGERAPLRKGPPLCLTSYCCSLLPAGSSFFSLSFFHFLTGSLQLTLVTSHPAEEERGVYCISNVLGKQVKFLIVSFVLLLLPCFTAVVQQERALVFRGYKNTLVPSVVTKYAAEWSSAEVFNRRPVSPKRSMKALQQGRKMFGYLK